MSTLQDSSGLGQFLTSLSDEQKKALIDSLQSQLGIKPFKSNNLGKEPEVPVKKKRGRPKKVVATPVLERKTTTKPIRGKRDKSIILDDYQEDLSEDEKRIREVSKKLNENRIPNRDPARSSTRIVKVECKNCKKEYSVAENFPNIKNFVCCRR